MKLVIGWSDRQQNLKNIFLHLPCSLSNGLGISCIHFLGCIRKSAKPNMCFLLLSLVRDTHFPQVCRMTRVQVAGTQRTFWLMELFLT